MRESTEQRAQTAASVGALGIVLFARTTINSSFRIVYPFLPVISRGLGVPLTATSLWLRGGLGLNAVVSCGAALAAFALLHLFVPEPGGSLELER